MDAPFAADTSLRQILRAFPQTAPVFERHGLLGCGGAEGPDEPLEFFARVHHVPFARLASELRDAINGTSAPAGARPARPIIGTPPGAAAENARRFVPFLAASLALTLTFGATLGMVNLIRLTTAWMGSLPRPSVWAHAYVQVFGFVGLFVMGVAYHVIPRFSGAALQSPGSAAWALRLQVGGVVTVAAAFLAFAEPHAAVWFAGSAALVAASMLFAASIARTLLAGARSREAFERWVIAGAGWLVVSSSIALVAALANDTTWHHVLWQTALYGFAGSWIFGVGRRIFPVFLGVKPRGARWEPRVFAIYQFGVLAWSAGTWPGESAAFGVLHAAGAAALASGATAFVVQLGVFRRREPPAPMDRGYEPYVFAAWAWLLVSLATGPLWTLAAFARGRYESVTVLDFSRHALALGFVTQMIMGVASRVLPVFTGHALWSPRARTFGFWLLNASLVVRSLEALVAVGIWPAAWPFIALSGPPAVAAVVLFAANVLMTIAVGGAPASQTARPAALENWIVADLLEIPGALDELVRAGFAPLANPVMRASLARTVTLAQACRLKGVALEPLVARLAALHARSAGAAKRHAGPPVHPVIPLRPL